MLFRLIIYVETTEEPDLHCINKKTGIPTLLKKQQQQQPAILFHAKLWTFPAGCLGDGW